MLVLPEARLVITPLKAPAWSIYLQTHPDQELVQFFLKGITQGFRIGFNYHSQQLKSSKKNLEGALSHPDVVQHYLRTEVNMGRLIGPLDNAYKLVTHISRFGVIPKSHQPNKWRLIVDLSHPVGLSVNDSIPKNLSSIVYITIDTAIQEILWLGKGTMLAKIDVKSAFRLMPVHPMDRHLLGMSWTDGIYIDTCLPFGLRSAPKLFNIMADLLAWILKQQGVSEVLHYLDDFLTIGPSSSHTCQQNLDIIKEICLQLGVPLAMEKVEGPTTSLCFLGINIDTEKMEARLPDDKLDRIRRLVHTWLRKRKARKREILSLVGLLQHATKIVRSGRTFVSRMYATAAKLKKMHYFTRLNRDFRSDLAWWHVFIHSWNGLSLLRCVSTVSLAFTVYTDVSGFWGCGACCGAQWLQWQWPQEWFPMSIMAKELVPIVFSCAVWGPQLSGRTILFRCDNSSVVAAVNKGTAKESIVMHLLRCLWFFTAFYDISLLCEHIAGKQNDLADHISRNHLQAFLCLNPQATFPTPIPPPLHQLLVSPSIDW